MKKNSKLIILFFILTLFLMNNCKKENRDNAIKNELKGTICISGAWALYPMTVKWAEEFQKLHKDIRIEISAGGAGKGMADVLADVVDIGMISRDIYTAEIEKGAWQISVTKDAVVPTVNEKNPFLNIINNTGLKRSTLEEIWINGKIQYWEEIIDKNNNKKNIINVYTRSDACGAAKTWAKYLGAHQEDLLGIGVYGDPGLTEAVKKDELAIGFNNINYAYDMNTKKCIQGIKILPIDFNDDGKIDSKENFYNTRDELVQAIRDNRYPSPPARLLYFVTHNKPSNKITLQFLTWVLTDGQKFVDESGYIKLNDDILVMELSKLSGESK